MSLVSREAERQRGRESQSARNFVRTPPAAACSSVPQQRAPAAAACSSSVATACSSSLHSPPEAPPRDREKRGGGLRPRRGNTVRARFHPTRPFPFESTGDPLFNSKAF